MSRVRVLIVVLVAAGMWPQAVLADEIGDSITEVKTLLKEDAPLEHVKAKLDRLADLDDPRVTKFVLKLTASKRDATAIAAYALAADRGDKKLVRLLKSRVDDKHLAKERPTVYTAVLDALVICVDASCKDVLEDVIQRYISTNSDFSTRAIRAYAKVRKKDVVDQLIKWLGQTESGSGTGTWEPLSPEARACRKKAEAVILDRLTELSGVVLADFDGWRKWWKENERKFKFPDPPTADEERG